MRTSFVLLPWFMLFAVCGACGSRPGEAARLQVTVAALSLPDLDDACYHLDVHAGTIPQTLAGDAPLVWSEGGLCADRFGDGRGSLAYVGTCDASVADNTVSLTLERLCTGGSCDPTLALDPRAVPVATYVNPCPDGAPCRLAAPCRPNADTPVSFNLTVMRDAGQGFFDIAIDFDDVSCSAKLDCADPLTGEPRALLFDGAARGPTVVLALACTAGTEAGVDTVLSLTDVTLACTDGWSAVIDPSAGAGGNLYHPSRNADIFQVATYEGDEALMCDGVPCHKRYWNLAIGVRRAELIAHHGDCRITAQATVSDGELVDAKTPDGWIYPVIDIDVPVTVLVPSSGKRELVCRAHGLGDGNGVTTDYVGPAAFGPFCNHFDGTSSERDPTCPPCAPGAWGPLCAEVCAQGACIGTALCDPTTGAWTGCDGCLGQSWYPDCDGDLVFSGVASFACVEPSRCDDGASPDGGWAHGPPANADCNDEDPEADALCGVVCGCPASTPMCVAGACVGPPGAPTGLTAMPGNGQAVVSWTAPASTGGLPITGYTVTASNGASVTTDGITTVVFAGLTNGVPYTFSVAATNDVGTGPASDASAPVVPAPPAPLGGVRFPDMLLDAGKNVRRVMGVDLDGDGRKDIALANFVGDTRIGVFLANTYGGFEGQVPYAAGDSPSEIDAADFDGDGELDLVTTNYLSHTLGIFFGLGDGTFAPQVTYPTGGTHGGAIGLADLDDDDDTDIVVTNAGSASVGVLLNAGDGTFGTPTTTAVGTSPTGPAIGDFDEDGVLDVAVTCGAVDLIYILLGNGDGTFVHAFTLPTGSYPFEVATADFNGDGTLDLAFPNYYPDSTVGVYFGTGTGDFTAYATYAVAPAVTGIAVGDVDGDGTVDIGSAGELTNTISILLNFGAGSFAPAVHYMTAPGAEHASSLAFADLDGDGRLDLIGANTGNAGATASVLWNVGAGRLARTVEYPVASDPRDVIEGDFDADGARDLAAVSASGAVTSYIGDGLGQLALAATVSVPGNLVAGTAGDFDGDDQLDLAIVDGVGNRLYALSGSGDGDFAATLVGTTQAGPGGVATGDLDGDDVLDIVVPCYGGQVIEVWRGDGTGAFTLAAAYTTGADRPIQVALGDFDRDGAIDIAAACQATSGSGSLRLYTNSGDGTFLGGVVRPTFDISPWDLAVADVDQDSALDLIVSNGLPASKSVSVFINGGAAGFATRVEYDNGGTSRHLATADFNGDGHLDWAVSDDSRQRTNVFLNNRDGTFAEPFSFAVPGGLVTGLIAVPDLDGDDRADLAHVAGHHKLGVMLNK